MTSHRAPSAAWKFSGARSGPSRHSKDYQPALARWSGIRAFGRPLPRQIAVPSRCACRYSPLGRPFSLMGADSSGKRGRRGRSRAARNALEIRRESLRRCVGVHRPGCSSGAVETESQKRKGRSAQQTPARRVGAPSRRRVAAPVEWRRPTQPAATTRIRVEPASRSSRHRRCCTSR